MEHTMVIKRNGSTAPFDQDRIRAAIQKAAHGSQRSISEETLSETVSRVLGLLGERASTLPPRVEEIQDLVEGVLMTQGWTDTAKAYILYRDEHARNREAQRQAKVQAAQTGALEIRAKDGRLEKLDKTALLDKLRSIQDCPELSDLCDLALASLYPGASSMEVHQALILAATAFMERDPAYDHLASALLREQWLEELGIETFAGRADENAYRSAFVQGIRRGLDLGQLDKTLGDFDLHSLAQILDPDLDRLLDYQGLETLHGRYALKEGDTVLESPQGFWLRVAMGLSLGDNDPGPGSLERTSRVAEFYHALAGLACIPSTPTLFHSGTSRPQLSSCYLSTVEDDLAHIFKVLGDNAQLSKYSGGIGNDWTNVRATGSWIKTIGVNSQGLIPFLKIANDATHAINRSGKRRGAACAYLELWHLDFEDFLDLKRNTGDERRRTHDLNTAAWVPDLFMKRLAQDGMWTFFSPDEVPELHGSYGKAFEKAYLERENQAERGEIRLFRQVEASKLWKKMLTRLFETGHPWITFKDPCNIRSPQDHVGVIHNSNLCTEITLNTSREETAVCNLASINLAAHLKHHAGGTVSLDMEKLGRTVKTAVRMLDNVIDINFYPTVEARNSNAKHRPVGLGLMGFQDLLLEMDLAYEDPAALELASRSMEAISYHAILASSNLAAERGCYHSYPGSKWQRGILPQDSLALVQEERAVALELPQGEALLAHETLDWSVVRRSVAEQGMRNSNLLAIAPTATISTLAGTYPSFEPLYKNLYVKSNMTGEFTVLNKVLVRRLKEQGLWNKEVLNQLKAADGRLQDIPVIPEAIKRVHKESFDISPMLQVAFTALRQVWIDQSQSHNIFLRGSSGRELSDIYQAAWRAGLKTTYYLRTLAASTVEKSTLDAKVFGFTQKRLSIGEAEPGPKACLVDDPSCESCQ